MGRFRRAAGAFAVGVTAAATLVTVTTAPASAAVTKVQSPTRVTASNGTIAASFSATTAGNLLIAAVGYSGTTPAFSAPSGWVKAISFASTLSETEIWYYANNPGGITSVSFSYTSGSTATLQLSEWSGLATTSVLDKTGTSTASATTVTVTATSTVASGELAISSFAEGFSTST